MPGRPGRRAARTLVLERVARNETMSELELKEASRLWPYDIMEAAKRKCGGDLRAAIALMGAPELALPTPRPPNGGGNRLVTADPHVRELMLERFTDPMSAKRRILARLLAKALAPGPLCDESLKAIDLLAKLNGWFAPTKSIVGNISADTFASMLKEAHEPAAPQAVDIEVHR